MADQPVDALERAIGALPIPGLPMTVAESRAAVAVDPGSLRARVTLGFPPGDGAATLAAAIARLPGAGPEPRVEWRVVPHAVQGNLTPLPGVRNVIAIASGKGGVGKSTTAVNLALALAADGARVGVLDADVYGPSQPLMLGLLGAQPESLDGKTFEPLRAHGIETNSVGFLVREDTPVIWRGPMVTQAVQQLALQTNWGNLDYLLVDLPPGTGDTQLTVSQKVPLAGAVVVTTPQDVATQVARRGLAMFEKVGVAILGVIENMSGMVCSRCGHEEPVFGEGGGRRLAEAAGVPLLGSVPLAGAIRAQTDSGRPPVVADPAGALATRYRQIARRLAAEVARRPADQSHKFGRIVVEEKK